MKINDLAYFWEQRKGSELFVSITKKGDVSLPVLSASQELGMIPRDQIGIDIKFDHDNTSNYKIVRKGQFVIHLRSFQGGLAYATCDGITSPAYTIVDFLDKKSQLPLFWKYIFISRNFIKRLESVTYGIRDGKSISFSEFCTLKFYAPKIEEQRKIVTCLETLDSTITLHQRNSSG